MAFLHGGREEIRALKEAEAEASHTIELVREERAQVLKAAQKEAEDELQQYRAEREKSLNAATSTDAQTSSRTAELQERADAQIAKLKEEFEQNRPAVEDFLIAFVTNTSNPFKDA